MDPKQTSSVGENKMIRKVYSLSELTVPEMTALCGLPVKVRLKSHPPVVGNIYTIDPISKSVVLIQQLLDGTILVDLC